MGIKPVADWHKESSIGVENGKVAQKEEGVRKAGLRRGSKRLPESMHVVGRTSGERKRNTGELGSRKRPSDERRRRRANWLDGGARMNAKQSDVNYFSRMEAVKRIELVKEVLKVKEKNHCSLMPKL